MNEACCSTQTIAKGIVSRRQAPAELNGLDPAKYVAEAMTAAKRGAVLGSQHHVCEAWSHVSTQLIG